MLRTQNNGFENKIKQIEAIERNIHFIEATRNKLEFTFLDLVYSFNLVVEELAPIYQRWYPHVLSNLGESVDATKNPCKKLVESLLKDTTLSPHTIGLISGISTIYTYAQKYGIWPKNRTENTTSSTPINTMQRPKIELKGNKREIKIAIGKIKDLMNALAKAAKLFGNKFDHSSFVSLYIADENNFFEKNIDEISSVLTTYRASDTEKILESSSIIRIEVSRHQHSINELLSISENEAIV